MKHVRGKRMAVILGFALLMTCSTVFAQTSAILDIKPGSCKNPVNLASKGVTPMVILGANGFDVANIDLATLQLAVELQNGPLVLTLNGVPIQFLKKTILEDLDSPAVAPLTCEDEAPDGYVDLLLRYRTQDIAKALKEAGVPFKRGDTLTLTVSATLKDGSAVIEASDQIFVLMPKKK